MPAVIDHRSAPRQHKINALRAVERTATTQSQNRVDTLTLRNNSPRLDLPHIRILAKFVEWDDANPHPL